MKLTEPPKSDDHGPDQVDDHHPEGGGDDHAPGPVGDPDDALGVEEQHGAEHADGAEHRLHDDAAPLRLVDVGDRAEEQALEERVGRAR